MTLVLKISLRLFIAIVSLSLINCTDIEPKEGNLGKEASTSQMQKAIESALSGVSIYNATPQQKVSYAFAVRIENGPYILSRIVKTEFLSATQHKNVDEFVLKHDKWLYDLSTNDPDDLKDEDHSDLHVYFERATQTPAKTIDLFAKYQKSKDVKVNSANACDGKNITDDEGHTYDCIKYYNLSLKVKLADVPEAVKNRPFCAGKTDCKMTIHHLKYDQVKWRAGFAVDRLQIDAEIAKDVPDILYYKHDELPGAITTQPPTLSMCLSGKAAGNVKVTQCSALADFEI